MGLVSAQKVGSQVEGRACRTRPFGNGTGNLGSLPGLELDDHAGHVTQYVSRGKYSTLDGIGAQVGDAFGSAAQ